MSVWYRCSDMKRTYPPHVMEKRRAYAKAYYRRLKTQSDKTLLINHAMSSNEYYWKNRTRILAAYAERRDLMRAAKDCPCADCGKSYPPYVMEFDHVRGEKKFILSAVGTRSKQAILDEIAKCDPVCANCHRERTHQRKQHLAARKYRVDLGIEAAAGAVPLPR